MADSEDVTCLVKIKNEFGKDEFYEAVIENVDSPTRLIYTFNPISKVAHIQHILPQDLTARATEEVPRVWEEAINASDNTELMRQYLLQGDARRNVARSLEALQMTHADALQHLPTGSPLQKHNAHLRQMATKTLQESIAHLEETISDTRMLSPAALMRE